MSYLNREMAPFDPALWEQIDAEAVTAARETLSARRFLDVQGPYGLGLTSVEIGEDGYCSQVGEGEAGAVLSRALSVPMLRKEFLLSIRRIEAYSSMGQPLDLSPVQTAAEAVARREEGFIYYGHRDFGLDGLMTAANSLRHNIGDWANVDQALTDVLRAVELLDGEGCHGPYVLALSPVLYNGLFRRYEGTDMLQLEHLGRLCQRGVFKAPVEGGVVLDATRAGRLLIGQDLRAGYTGHDGIHYRLYVSESIVLVLDQPQAVCRLERAG